MNSEQKQRLLDVSEQIEETGKHLSNGYRIAVETEELGSKMLQDLYAQRETIQSSLHRVRCSSFYSIIIYFVNENNIYHSFQFFFSFVWKFSNLLNVLFFHTFHTAVLRKKIVFPFWKF